MADRAAAPHHHRSAPSVTPRRRAGLRPRRSRPAARTPPTRPFISGTRAPVENTRRKLGFDSRGGLTPIRSQRSQKDADAESIGIRTWGSQRPMMIDDRPPQEIGGTDPETHSCPICGDEIDGAGKSLRGHVPRCRRTSADDQQLLSEYDE